MFPDDVAIWFGILVLIVVGIGLTAPPIGLNVFVVSAIAKDVPITAIYRGRPALSSRRTSSASRSASPSRASLALVRWLT